MRVKQPIHFITRPQEIKLPDLACLNKSSPSFRGYDNKSTTFSLKKIISITIVSMLSAIPVIGSSLYVKADELQQIGTKVSNKDILNLAENCFAAALLKVYQEGYAPLIETVKENLDQYTNIPSEKKEKLRPLFEQYDSSKKQLDNEKLTSSFILLNIKMGTPTKPQVKALGTYLSSIDKMFDTLMDAIKNEPAIDMKSYSQSLMPLEENRIFAEGALKNFIRKDSKNFVSNWDFQW